MKRQQQFNDNIIRPGSRMRESVRSLPKGHFQKIKQMFDKQTSTTKKLSTIQEREQKSSSSTNVLLHLPVTDDEKLKHSTTINERKFDSKETIEQGYRDYLAEYREYRLKLTNELNQHKKDFSNEYNELLLKKSTSLPNKNQPNKEIISHSTSQPQLSPVTDFEQSNIFTVELNKHRRLMMSTVINYNLSSKNDLNKQEFNSGLQHTVSLNAHPVFITTGTAYSPLKRTETTVSNELYERFQSPRCLHSSTSLSTTGYDSNSSPSIKSKRNSIATNNSNDLVILSTCSSSCSSSDEQQSKDPWVRNRSNSINPSISSSTYYDDLFERSNCSSPLISRKEIQLNQPKFEQNSTTNIRRATIRNSTSNKSSPNSNHQPTQVSPTMDNSSYFVQTTSFPDKNEKKIRRWNNVYLDHIKQRHTPYRNRKYPRISTISTGFEVMNLNNEQIISPMYSNVEEKSSNLQTEIPIINHLPPKKPPRTFEQETKINDPNRSSLDLANRSVSCMDLTSNTTNVLLSNSVYSTEDENIRLSRISSQTKRRTSFAIENLNSKEQENNQTNEIHLHSPMIKSKLNHSTVTLTNKSTMKKGISEPNLTKTSRTKSPFSPRGLLDRFKRILPLSLSKQSLNHNDSDDSTSTSSENNDQLRSSRLDHVSRVKHVYNTLNRSNHMPSLLPNTTTDGSTNLYDYVVLILLEQENGFFTNYNSHTSKQQFSTSIDFKYPINANDEKTLKDFCFPEQYDSNNNSLTLTKKPVQEYFRFTLTNMDGTRQYGYCSRFFHKGVFNALCIVSPYDMIEIYEKILSTTTELFLSYKDDDAKLFLKEIYEHRLPNRGDTIHIQTTTVGVFTLHCEYDRRKQLIDSVTLLNLSTETIIKIFSSILYEQKLIFISNEIGSLTRLINTFVSLLYPFSWPHTFVPILPGSMLDIIQAPTPYIIGILRSCESYLSANDDLLSQDNSDILIVDIDHDRIRSMSDYVSNTSYRSSFENLHNFSTDRTHFQILPKVFKIELKQEISHLRKTRSSLSLDECQQRLCDVFMSIFVQSCYNYKDYYNEGFHKEDFVQSKQHTIELFLEWFTRTQIFELFIQQKFESENSNQIALTFDFACENHSRTLNKSTPRVTVKSVKRKSATRVNKQDHRF